MYAFIHIYTYIYSKLSYISWDDDPPVRYVHYLEKEKYKVWEGINRQTYQDVIFIITQND